MLHKASNHSLIITLLTLSVSGAALYYFGFVHSLNKYELKNLIPPPEQRVDIKEIFFGDAETLCEKFENKNSLNRNFEECIRRIQKDPDILTDKISKIKIGNFEDFQSGRMKGFRRYVEELGRKDLVDILLKAKTYVLGIKVPSQYFSVRGFGQQPYVIHFFGLRDFNVCIEGDCSFSDNFYGQDLISIPLYKEDRLHTGEHMIWIFANDGPVPIGPVLNHGIFITEKPNLKNLLDGFAISANGKSMAITYFLGSFFALCAFIGLVTGYLDFSLLTYLIASLLVFSVVWRNGFEIAGNDPLRAWQLTAACGWNFLLSSVLFALSTNRGKWRNMSVVFGGMLGIFSGLILVYEVLPDSPQAYVQKQWMLWKIFSITYSLVTVGIFVATIVSFAIKLRNESDILMRLTFKKRILEQLILSIIFGSFGLLLIFATNYGAYRSAIANVLFPYGAIFILAIASVLVHSSMIRQQRVSVEGKGDDISKRIARLHGSKIAADFRAQKRSSILLSFDLANSTLVTDSMDSDMHYVMKTLLSLIKATHSKLGFDWLFHKTNGDAHLILLSHKDGLEEDLVTICNATLEQLPNYKKALQFFDTRLDLHVDIMTITDYQLGENPHPKNFNLDQLQKLIQTLSISPTTPIPESDDFISSDSNYFMKAMGNPKPNTIRIFSRIEYVKESLLEKASDIEALTDILKKQNRDSRAIDYAEACHYIVASIPEQQLSTTHLSQEKLHAIKTRFTKNHAA